MVLVVVVGSSSLAALPDFDFDVARWQTIASFVSSVRVFDQHAIVFFGSGR